MSRGGDAEFPKDKETSASEMEKPATPSPPCKVVDVNAVKHMVRRRGLTGANKGKDSVRSCELTDRQTVLEPKIKKDLSQGSY